MLVAMSAADTVRTGTQAQPALSATTAAGSDSGTLPARIVAANVVPGAPGRPRSGSDSGGSVELRASLKSKLVIASSTAHGIGSNGGINNAGSARAEPASGGSEHVGRSGAFDVVGPPGHDGLPDVSQAWSSWSGGGWPQQPPRAVPAPPLPQAQPQRSRGHRRSGVEFGVRFEQQPTVVVWPRHDADDADMADDLAAGESAAALARARHASPRRRRTPRGRSAWPGDTTRAPSVAFDLPDADGQERPRRERGRESDRVSHGTRSLSNGSGNRRSRQGRLGSESDAESLRPPLSVVSDMTDVDIDLEGEFQYEANLLFPYVVCSGLRQLNSRWASFSPRHMSCAITWGQ